MSFGSILRRVRHARDFDQATLGAALGVSNATISQWENERRLPDVGQLAALCRILHVSADMMIERVPFAIEALPETET